MGVHFIGSWMVSIAVWAVLDKRKISGFCRNSKVSSGFRLLYCTNRTISMEQLVFSNKLLLNRCIACELLQFGHYAH